MGHSIRKRLQSIGHDDSSARTIANLTISGGVGCIVNAMGPTTEIDRDALHRLLWNRSNSRGRITFRVDQFSEDLGISKYTLSRIMVQFVREGRATKLTGLSSKGTTYRMADPDMER